MNYLFNFGFWVISTPWTPAVLRLTYGGRYWWLESNPIIHLQGKYLPMVLSHWPQHFQICIMCFNIHILHKCCWFFHTLVPIWNEEPFCSSFCFFFISFLFISHPVMFSGSESAVCKTKTLPLCYHFGSELLCFLG